jgi:hypothetical protein
MLFGGWIFLFYPFPDDRENAILGRLSDTNMAVRKLLNNPAVAGFLNAHYAEIHAEFNALVATESL